jgi:hypothetical protein
VTGIPAGTNLTITVSNGTNTACDVSQNVTAPNCNCPPTAAPTIAVPTDTICAGTAIPAFTASVPAGLTVIWYDAATGGTVLLTNSLSFTPTMAGTYFAEAFDPVTGCRSATRTPVVLDHQSDPDAELHAGATHLRGRNLQPSGNLRQRHCGNLVAGDQQHGNNNLYLHAECRSAPLRRDNDDDRDR